MGGRSLLCFTVTMFLYMAFIFTPCLLWMIYIDAMKGCEAVARWTGTPCRNANLITSIFTTAGCFATVIAGVNLADRLASLLTSAARDSD